MSQMKQYKVCSTNSQVAAKDVRGVGPEMDAPKLLLRWIGASGCDAIFIASGWSPFFGKGQVVPKQQIR